MNYIITLRDTLDSKEVITFARTDEALSIFLTHYDSEKYEIMDIQLLGNKVIYDYSELTLKPINLEIGVKITGENNADK